MAQASKIFIETENEQDSDLMMAHINNKNAEKRAAEEDSRQKQMKEQEKIRLNTLGQYTIRCIVDALLFTALFGAMKAGLIASVIVIPATYLCAIRFGWCYNKVVHLAKKGRGSK